MHEKFWFLSEIMSPDSYSAVLCPAKIQNSEKNTGSWAAREKAEFEQVSRSLASYEISPSRKWTYIKFLPFCRYIPNATAAIYEILKEMSRSHASKRRRCEEKDAELLKQVSAQLVTEETLREKLAQHVEQVRSRFSFSCRVFGPWIHTHTHAQTRKEKFNNLSSSSSLD